MQVKAQPMNEEFPLKHPNQLSGNPALGLPLQFGRCDSCGAADLAKCEGNSPPLANQSGILFGKKASP
jgi:DNA-directed RNA polymerase-5 subunit 1